MKKILIGLAAGLMSTAVHAQTSDKGGSMGGVSAGGGEAGQSDQLLRHKGGGKAQNGAGTMGHDMGGSHRSGSTDVSATGEARSGSDTMIRHRRAQSGGAALSVNSRSATFERGGPDVVIRHKRIVRGESPDVVVHRRHTVSTYDEPDVTVVRKKRYVTRHHHGPVVTYRYRHGHRYYVQDEPSVSWRVRRHHVVRIGEPDSVTTIRHGRRFSEDGGVSIRMHGHGRGHFEQQTGASARLGGQEKMSGGQHRPRLQSEDRTGTVGGRTDLQTGGGAKSDIGTMQGHAGGNLPTKGMKRKLPGEGSGDSQ